MRSTSALSPVALAVFIGGCSGAPQSAVSTIPISLGSGSPASATLPPRAALSAGPQSARNNGPAAVGLWIAATSQNYIFGEDAGGKKTLAAIDAGANGCAKPTGIKVDHKHSLWAACAAGYPQPGSVQKYPPGSSAPSATYNDSYSSGSPTADRLIVHQPKGGGGSHCTFSGYPTDVAFDSRGHVFAANASSEGECGDLIMQPNLITFFDGPVVWWYAQSPKKVHLSISTQAETAAYDLDVDNAGNLYFDGGYGCQYSCQPAVFELSDPTSASGVLTMLTPPTSDQLGGVYVSNHGSVLNVVDETTRTISQYELPWIANETAFNVLGPTLARMGKGEPTSGGFNKGDEHLALGDADGWVDIGSVAANHWSAVSNKNLEHGNYGAAYVPSDK